MFGNIPPFFSPFPYGPIPSSGTASTKFVDLLNAQTVAGAKTFTDTATFNKTAETPAETIATFKVSDDAVSKIDILNATTSPNTFNPKLRFTGSSTNIAGEISATASSDLGSNPVLNTGVSLTNSAKVTVRPLWGVVNYDAYVLTALPLNSGANLALSWGTQTGAAPAFTTRSAGTRLVLYSAIDGSKVDNAIGVAASGLDTWYSVQQATTSYTHLWYAGTTSIMGLRGDGRLQTTGARIVKTRTALTSPVTVAAGTDYVIETDLTTPGAVAVNLPASPATGLTYIIKDGKGDANVNNVTITPAAGNIDGAGTYVINTAYGRVKLMYNGTKWLVLGT